MDILPLLVPKNIGDALKTVTLFHVLAVRYNQIFGLSKLQKNKTDGDMRRQSFDEIIEFIEV